MPSIIATKLIHRSFCYGVLTPVFMIVSLFPGRCVDCCLSLIPICHTFHHSLSGSATGYSRFSLQPHKGILEWVLQLCNVIPLINCRKVRARGKNVTSEERKGLRWTEAAGLFASEDPFSYSRTHSSMFPIGTELMMHELSSGHGYACSAR